MPPHWFTLFFADAARHSDLGPDGHPKPGVFLPPIPLPRRMGAGRRVRIAQSLRVGDLATRTAEVVAILPKQARTGFITVLTMRYTVRRGQDLVAVDEFDAIYREAVTPGERSAVARPQPAQDILKQLQAIGSSVKIDQMGVTIKGMMVKIEGTVMLEAKGLMTKINGDAMMMLKGGIIMIN